MSHRLEELVQRRLELQARCSVEREYFAGVAFDVRRNVAWIDRTILTAKRFVTSPLFVGGGILASVLVGPKRLLSWAGRGAMLMSLVKRFRR